VAVYQPLPVKQTLSVLYTVILSPSYQVPVLYLKLHNLPVSGPQGIDAVYHYLVPEQLKDGLRGTGVLGGVTMTVSRA
jgi:ubiquitin-like-conjugating enzyme ATG10